MTDEQIRLECLKLAHGDISLARQMVGFVLGLPTGMDRDAGGAEVGFIRAKVKK